MRFCPLLSIGLALSALSVRAYADDLHDAEVLLRLGVNLRREHRNEEALDAFRRALAISPTPTARAQVALAEQALGRWVEAEQDLVSALESSSDSWIDKNRSALEEARAQMTMHLGWLRVSVDAPESNIVLDGRSIATNTEERVLSGAGLLAVSATGYLPDTRPITISAGEHVRVEVVLVPLVAAPAPVAESPGAFAERPVQTSAASPSDTTSPAGPAVLGVTGLAALGTGAYLGVQAFDQKHQRDVQCSAGACPPSAFAIDGDARSSSLASTVAFGAGAACLTAGAAWWMLAKGRTGTSSRPWVGPVILGALGAATLGTGTYLGLLAVGDKRSRDAQCSSAGCGPAALSYDAEARTAADLSTVAFGVGAAVVAGAVALWALSPHGATGWRSGHASTDPHVAISPLGLILLCGFE